jgi:hypothetical protein
MGIDPFLFDAYLGLNGRLVLLNLLSNSPSRRQCNPCLLMLTEPSIYLFHHVAQFSFLQIIDNIKTRSLSIISKLDRFEHYGLFET